MSIKLIISAGTNQFEVSTVLKSKLVLNFFFNFGNHIDVINILASVCYE